MTAGDVEDLHGGAWSCEHLRFWVPFWVWGDWCVEFPHTVAPHFNSPAAAPSRPPRCFGGELPRVCAC